MRIKPHKYFQNVFWVDNKLCTKNLVPGEKVYGEMLIKTKEGEFREWIASRSKPSAAIHKGIHNFPLEEEMRVLYLGAASGTTVSHFSDIVGKKGMIYAVEISDRVLRELLPHAEKRKNIFPLLADARIPEEYAWIEEVDLIYADIAMKEQSIVLVRNAKTFLKSRGFAMIAIKSRSIDVAKKPKLVYKEQRKILEEIFNVIDFVTLDPYERDHRFFVLKKKN